MVAWMAYAAGAAGLLAAGAFLLEKVSEQAGWPRRSAWLAGLALALLVPLFASPPRPTPGTEPLPTEVAPKAEAAPDTPAGLPAAALVGETADPGGEPGAAVLPDGRLVVRDPGNLRVQVFGPGPGEQHEWTYLSGNFYSLRTRRHLSGGRGNSGWFLQLPEPRLRG